MQKPDKSRVETKRRVTPPRVTGWATLALGATALIVSVIYDSQILAFIGLGLVFWGIVLTYIKTDEYMKENLFDASLKASLEPLNQMIEGLDYKGKAVYLPPKYFTDLEISRVYIPKQNAEKLPPPDKIQGQENKLFLEDPQGILLTPTGAELTKLFEKTLGTSFTRTDLQYAQQSMPKLFMEDLEIAQNFEMENEKNKITVRISNSAYRNVTLEAQKLSRVYSSMGCPLSSAIACALAKATGKPVIIENQQVSDDGKDIEIEYRTLEEE